MLRVDTRVLSHKQEIIPPLLRLRGHCRRGTENERGRGGVAHIFSPSTEEAGAGGSQWVRGQPGLRLSQKDKQKGPEDRKMGCKMLISGHGRAKAVPYWGTLEEQVTVYNRVPTELPSKLQWTGSPMVTQTILVKTSKPKGVGHGYFKGDCKQGLTKEGKGKLGSGAWQ